MKTIRRLIYSEVLRAVGFVTLAFLALFFFFDLVDALGDVRDGAARGYTMGYALLVVLLIGWLGYALMPWYLVEGMSLTSWGWLAEYPFGKAGSAAIAAVGAVHYRELGASPSAAAPRALSR